MSNETDAQLIKFAEKNIAPFVQLRINNGETDLHKALDGAIQDYIDHQYECYRQLVNGVDFTAQNEVVDTLSPELYEYFNSKAQA